MNVAMGFRMNQSQQLDIIVMLSSLVDLPISNELLLRSTVDMWLSSNISNTSNHLLGKVTFRERLPLIESFTKERSPTVIQLLVCQVQPGKQCPNISDRVESLNGAPQCGHSAYPPIDDKWSTITLPTPRSSSSSPLSSSHQRSSAAASASYTFVSSPHRQLLQQDGADMTNTTEPGNYTSTPSNLTVTTLIATLGSIASDNPSEEEVTVSLSATRKSPGGSIANNGEAEASDSSWILVIVIPLVVVLLLVCVSTWCFLCSRRSRKDRDWAIQIENMTELYADEDGFLAS